jgi:predicted HTH transcriptional regulator
MGRPKQHGGRTVDQLCSSETPESQQLEFKSKTNPNSAELSKEDKRNLGRSLSAFSHATGGIVIFGIETAGDGEELSAGKPAPISQLAAFSDRVNGLVGQLLSAPNPKAEILPIPSARADGSGFLAIRVGECDLRPHMSMATDHQRYYQRAGSSTIPMVDFRVRDMLRVRTAPVLFLSTEFVIGSTTRNSVGKYTDID